MTDAAEDSKLTRVFSRTPSSWDPQDDLLLRHLKEHQKLGWKEIASHFAHRTPNACQFRWRRLRSGLLKTGSPASAETSPAAPNVGAAGAANTATTTTTTTTNNATTTVAVSTKTSISSNVSTPSHDSISIKEDSTSPATSPDPSVASPYQKFPTLPQQVKSNASLNKSTSPNYSKWNFNTATNSNACQTSSAKISKRRHSMKVAPNESIFSSNTSSSDDDDMDKVRSSSVTSLSTIGNWTSEEDELLLTRKRRQLSFIELSILLPRRTEKEINSRIDQLEHRSKSTSAIDNKVSLVKQSHSHSHPLPMHTTNHIIQPPKQSGFTRSYSSSSQTSTVSLISSSARNRSNSFINQDFTRVRSYSITSPYITSAPFSISERYNARKSSISSIPMGTSMKGKPRSDSMRQSHSYSAYSSDEEDIVQHNTSNIRVEPIKSSLPPLGSLFNEYYTK